MTELHEGSQRNKQKFNPLDVWMMGFWHILVIAALLYSIRLIWPTALGSNDTPQPLSVAAQNGVKQDPNAPGITANKRETGDGSQEVSLLLLVMAFGALGGGIQAGFALAAYVGTDEAERSWILWYLLRPFVGSALAVVFYGVLRGGIITSVNNASSVNIFFISGMAGLVGIFSRVAMQKLQAAFGGKPAPEPTMKRPPLPIIDHLQPTNMPLGSAEGSIQVIGRNFATNAYVQANGIKQETHVQSVSLLKVQIAQAQRSVSGTVKITVVNPATGGDLISSPVNLTISKA